MERKRTSEGYLLSREHREGVGGLSHDMERKRESDTHCLKSTEGD
jgi:hypothetical protein